MKTLFLVTIVTGGIKWVLKVNCVVSAPEMSPKTTEKKTLLLFIIYIIDSFF